jgi:Fur family zinc uptake transcriptional regulator
MERTTPKGVRAPQQIYRALQGLVGHRLIHRIETLNAYLACDHAPHDHQAAFTVCTGCGRVDEVPLGKTVSSLARAVAKTGFAVQATHLELSGLCAACQAGSSG